MPEITVDGDTASGVWAMEDHLFWPPDTVLAWGESYDSPLWEGRNPGFAYVCRDYVCEAPVSTPEALYEKLTGRPVPEGSSIGLPPTSRRDG